MPVGEQGCHLIELMCILCHTMQAATAAAAAGAGGAPLFWQGQPDSARAIHWGGD